MHLLGAPVNNVLYIYDPDDAGVVEVGLEDGLPEGSYPVESLRFGG